MVGHAQETIAQVFVPAPYLADERHGAALRMPEQGERRLAANAEGPQAHGAVSGPQAVEPQNTAAPFWQAPPGIARQ